MVTSLAEVWIETIMEFTDIQDIPSLPLRKCGLKHWKIGVIEMLNASLPLRKCGLKLLTPRHGLLRHAVTSLAEVWIETSVPLPTESGSAVTSLAEVWIETANTDSGSITMLSLPLRKCGLKLSDAFAFTINLRHFPCGSVD